MKTDTSEKGLEPLIVADMTGRKAPIGGGHSEEPEPLRLAAVSCTSRSTTRRSVLHPVEGQRLVVPAVQQGLERRSRQPAYNPAGLKTDYLWKDNLWSAGMAAFQRRRNYSVS
jgi:hypothetical protein